MEYLYSQTGKWCPLDRNDPDTPNQFEDAESDEGFEEGEFNDLTAPPLSRTTIPGNKTMSLHILAEVCDVYRSFVVLIFVSIIITDEESPPTDTTVIDEPADQEMSDEAVSKMTPGNLNCGHIYAREFKLWSYVY